MRPALRPGVWVLLRGLTRDSRHWGGFPEQLREALPDARVVPLDLPGNGLLNDQTSPTRVEAMADHCRAELRRQGLPPPYGVLAMSLGAMVTVAWAQQAPQDLAAGVLINTSLRPFSPFYQRLRPANYPTLLRLLIAGGSPMEWEQAVLRMTSRQVRAPEPLLALWEGFRRQRPVARRNALNQLVAAARCQAPSARPAPPLLLLSSAQDGLVNPRCSAALARAWGLEQVVHPDAGHDLPLDDGAWVAAQVRRWVFPAR
jgi:pimeloyl-ACP methyl ester carboxylesterase